MGWLEEWSDVGRSLHASSRALGRWTFADFTVGLTYLRERQRLAYELDPGLKARGLRGRPRVAPERLRELEWACELADIAYSGDEEVMRKFLSEFGLVLVHGETESSWRSPAFFWAYSKAARQVVVAVRGTASQKDVFTDLDSVGEAHGGHVVHRGMMRSAAALHAKLRAPLADLAEEGFKVIVTGHSLGAGTASLLAILLRESGIRDLQCYAIACPPVHSPGGDHDFIRALVFNDDVVPRLSLANVKRVNAELLGLDWGALATADFTATRAGQVAEHLGVKCQEVAARVGSTRAASSAVAKVGALAGFASKLRFQKKPQPAADGPPPGPSGCDAPDGPSPDGGGGPTDAALVVPGRSAVFIDALGDAYEVEPSTFEGLARVELTDRMVSDHYLTNYFDGLKACLGEPVLQPVLVLTSKMLKLEGGNKARLGVAGWKPKEVELWRLRRTYRLVYRYPAAKEDAKEVNLKGAHVAADLHDPGRPLGFAINGPNVKGGPLRFDAGSETVRREWLLALSTLLHTG